MDLLWTQYSMLRSTNTPKHVASLCTCRVQLSTNNRHTGMVKNLNLQNSNFQMTEVYYSHISISSSVSQNAISWQMTSRHWSNQVTLSSDKQSAVRFYKGLFVNSWKSYQHAQSISETVLLKHIVLAWMQEASQRLFYSNTLPWHGCRKHLRDWSPQTHCPGMDAGSISETGLLKHIALAWMQEASQRPVSSNTLPWHGCRKHLRDCSTQTRCPGMDAGSISETGLLKRIALAWMQEASQRPVSSNTLPWHGCRKHLRDCSTQTRCPGMDAGSISETGLLKHIALAWMQKAY